VQEMNPRPVGVAVAAFVECAGRGETRGSGCELVQAIRGWDALRVRAYGQYCPIARASDLLAERWSIILRNILIGCRTFNEIADGARN
jgi:hypothetical protein